MVSASPIAPIASTRARFSVVARRRSARPVASTASWTVARRLSSRASPLAGGGGVTPSTSLPRTDPSTLGHRQALRPRFGRRGRVLLRRSVRGEEALAGAHPGLRLSRHESTAAAIEAAVAAGTTAVILSDPSGDATTRELFDAALSLERGRRRLVLVGDDGVPVVVARKSLAGPAIVACAPRDAAGIVVAAKEGADLVIAPSAEAAEETRGVVSTPVFAPIALGRARERGRRR